MENNFEAGSEHFNHIEVEDNDIENNKKDEVVVADVNLEQEGLLEHTRSSETKTNTSDSGLDALKLEYEGSNVDEELRKFREAARQEKKKRNKRRATRHIEEISLW